MLNIDVDTLFERHSVQEIEQIEKMLQTEVEKKKEELRTMVGECYRDLLKAADTIAQMKDRHIPALAIASAINERLTDLLAGSRVFASVNSGNFQRFLMYSEAARRQTFEKWPHMDYKWALPDQMAQAGFYHQPSVTGDDRAMCFTCNVCLVCWEKNGRAMERTRTSFTELSIR